MCRRRARRHQFSAEVGRPRVMPSQDNTGGVMRAALTDFNSKSCPDLNSKLLSCSSKRAQTVAKDEIFRLTVCSQLSDRTGPDPLRSFLLEGRDIALHTWHSSRAITIPRNVAQIILACQWLR